MQKNTFDNAGLQWVPRAGGGFEETGTNKKNRICDPCCRSAGGILQTAESSGMPQNAINVLFYR
jgi:hypothetical protein